MLRAAQRLAAHLNEIGRRLPGDQRSALPHAMARYITGDLQRITP